MADSTIVLRVNMFGNVYFNEFISLLMVLDSTRIPRSSVVSPAALHDGISSFS
jgi:hypothetical protein